MKLINYIIRKINYHNNPQLIEFLEYEEEVYAPDYPYWNNPVLDDEGTYDYYATPIPPNSQIWTYDKDYYHKCEQCGNETKLWKTYEDVFRTTDGWDSNEYTSCWKCELKDKTHRTISKFRPYKLYKRYKFCKQKDLPVKNIYTDWLWTNTSWR